MLVYKSGSSVDSRSSNPSTPGSDFICAHSPRSKEEMSRACHDLSPLPAFGDAEDLACNKEWRPTIIEPCLSGANNSRANEAFSAHRNNKTKSRSCMYQFIGFCLSFLGWMCSLATTMLREWMTMNGDLIVTEVFSIGLWDMCVAQDDGPIQCKAYDTLLGLPEDIQMARIFMCTSIALGLLSFVFSLSGSRSVTCCGDNSARKGMLMVSGGVLSILAGLTTLIPVSYIAHLTVVKFWGDEVPDFVPRWEFGQALFVGWAGSFLQLPGGLLLIIAQCCFRKPRSNIHLKPPLDTMRRQPWYKVEYV
ncbi:putative claudin-24 isoform X2 [Narcine bancroftii]|uniref:putative claudin-24 isoform X2 n=1 Tax=Narcine bancroftii TaxID=1343680 RepID=UPI00383147C7